jgi:hypothetical protein
MPDRGAPTSALPCKESFENHPLIGQRKKRLQIGRIFDKSQRT